MSPAPSLWLRRAAPVSAPRLRLICFPYAGGGSTVYRGWNAGLPADVELHSVLLPGRESRLAEAPCQHLDVVVHSLTDELEPLLDRPTAFFGHSLGALLAFEVVRELRRRGAPEPRHLFASAFRAPFRPPGGPMVHRLDEAALVDELRSYGGIPTEVLENAELMTLVLPALRADFALHETYVYEDEEPLDCPLTALAGRQDDKVPPEMVHGWERMTRANYRLELFDGDHFFLHARRDEVLRLISAELRAGWVNGG